MNEEGQLPRPPASMKSTYGAAPAFAHAASWAREVAGAHVPGEFRAGFLSGQPLPATLA